MTHLTTEVLSDVLDRRLSAAARADAEAHLASCAECRESLQWLQNIDADARALPRSVKAPDGLWDDVRATIEARRVRPLRTRWSFSPRIAIAAAALFMAAGSAATLLVTRRTTPNVAATPLVMPATWQATEQGYLDNVATLQAVLEQQRGQLNPATVAAVEQALRSIDAAIAEARAALMVDPANAAIGDLLASNYRQKVELLRRATQLVTS